ncbi:phosphotransferase [Jatrophihabitans fulvus]
MNDALAAVRALLPGEQLRDVAVLKAGDRTTVHRVEATDDGGSVRSLVVKRYHEGTEGWLRETAALASVPGAVRVPAVVAVGVEPPVLVMEDLGDGAGLADALDGDDPAAADAAVMSWAEALAELQAATRGSREHFRAALADRSAALQRGDERFSEPEESSLASRLREAELVLDRVCGALGVRIPTGALTTLTGLSSRLGADAEGGLAALTPADTCPGNTVRIGDRLVLIDFEDAQWRHLAWDLAYLLVPWPTCPNAWHLPDDTAWRAVAWYRENAAVAFPAVRGEAFGHDLGAAVAAWSLVTTSWSLEHLLGSDDLDEHDTDRPGPTRRALIMHRLRRAAGPLTAGAGVDPLAELADGLWAALQHRWGDVPLDVAPAYRDGGRPRD